MAVRLWLACASLPSQLWLLSSLLGPEPAAWVPPQLQAGGIWELGSNPLGLCVKTSCLLVSPWPWAPDAFLCLRSCLFFLFLQIYVLKFYWDTILHRVKHPDVEICEFLLHVFWNCYSVHTHLGLTRLLDYLTFLLYEMSLLISNLPCLILIYPLQLSFN